MHEADRSKHRLLSFSDSLRALSSPVRGYAAVLILGLSGCGRIPRISVDADGALVTSEGGASVELAISLARRPSGVITVAATSSDEAEGIASDPVRFDAHNWREPQIICPDHDRDGFVRRMNPKDHLSPLTVRSQSLRNSLSPNCGR